MTATAKQFLSVLASQLGYHEGRDPDGNWNNITKYGAWYGMNGEPWCAMLDSWAADQVGALGTIVPKFASVSAGLKWFRARGQTGVFPPRPGDFGMVLEYLPTAWWADPSGWATVHVFAVEQWTPLTADSGYSTTLEGNTNTGGSAQGDGVYRLRRYDTRTSPRIIYCRPAWAPEPAPKPAPKPAPAPAPKPIPGATYTGSRAVAVAAVRPGRRNEASRRFNGLLWAWLCQHSPAYARAHAAAWMREAANLYGQQSQLATQEAYRVIRSLGLVTLPTFPGPQLVRRLGGTPI